MSIARRINGTSSGGVLAATGVSVSLGSGVTDGDIVIVTIGLTVSEAVTPPAGYVLIVNTPTSGALGCLATFQHVWKSGDATSGLSFTFGLASAAWATAAYINEDQTPVLISAGQGNAASTTATSPSVNPTTDQDMLLMVYATPLNDTYSVPSIGSINVQAIETTVASVCIADALLSSNAATGNQTITLSSSAASAGQQISIAPTLDDRAYVPQRVAIKSFSRLSMQLTGRGEQLYVPQPVDEQHAWPITRKLPRFKYPAGVYIPAFEEQPKVDTRLLIGMEFGDLSEWDTISGGVTADGTVSLKGVGKYSLKSVWQNGQNYVLKTTSVLSSTTLYVKTWLRTDAGGSTAAVGDVIRLIDYTLNNQSSIRLVTDGAGGLKLRCYNFANVVQVGADFTIQPSTDYCVELYTKNTGTGNSTIEMRIDGKVVATSTTQTLNGKQFYRAQFGLATTLGAGTFTGNVWFDHICIQTDKYPGPGFGIARQLQAGTPTYDQWTKNGLSTAALCWSDTPFESVNNCSDAVLGHAQTALLASFGLPGSAQEGGGVIASQDIINGAKVALVAKSTAANKQLAILRRMSGLETRTSKILTASDALYESDIFVPTVQQLTDNTSEIGAVNTSPTGTTTVEAAWMYVDFTPNTEDAESLPRIAKFKRLRPPGRAIDYAVYTTPNFDTPMPQPQSIMKKFARGRAVDEHQYTTSDNDVGRPQVRRWRGFRAANLGVDDHSDSALPDAIQQRPRRWPRWRTIQSEQGEQVALSLGGEAAGNAGARVWSGFRKLWRWVTGADLDVITAKSELPLVMLQTSNLNIVMEQDTQLSRIMRQDRDVTLTMPLNED